MKQSAKTFRINEDCHLLDPSAGPIADMTLEIEEVNIADIKCRWSPQVYSKFYEVLERVKAANVGKATRIVFTDSVEAQRYTHTFYGYAKARGFKVHIRIIKETIFIWRDIPGTPNEVSLRN